MLNIKKKSKGNSKIFLLGINKYLYVAAILCLVIFASLYLKSRYVVPIERVTGASSLLMLGDLNNDNKWDINDKKLLDIIINTPWKFNDNTLFKIDINKNKIVDTEDIRILNKLYSVETPYLLQTSTTPFATPAPKPRELFRYISDNEYIQRPAYGLQHTAIHTGPVNFLSNIILTSYKSPYLTRLTQEIYDEALRFSFIYKQRYENLSHEESAFVSEQILIVRKLFNEKNYYELLLNLILLSEAGETLSTKHQTNFIKNVRYLADDLRKLLNSSQYTNFQKGKSSWIDVFHDLDIINKARAGIDTPLQKLEPARDLTELQNYIDRAEWQYYKSKNTNDHFHNLINFAQNDRRYLRAVSNTSPRHQDINLQNHNLPMMLLFSQAMIITGNDKKLAVGLLDETIRVPFFWLKALPAKIRPSSVALEHFLLPGNMEDGSDKSRHWNVFGGLSLYRSPEESLNLAFQREVEDVRKANYSPQAMTEFIRDMIANCYGIYHIVSYNKINNAE